MMNLNAVRKRGKRKYVFGQSNAGRCDQYPLPIPARNIPGSMHPGIPEGAHGIQEDRIKPKTGQRSEEQGSYWIGWEEENCNGICRNIGKTIDKIDWKEVQAAVECGKARTSFPVGTEIRIWLKDGRAAAFVVAAVDHYQHGELVFMSRDCIGKEQV